MSEATRTGVLVLVTGTGRSGTSTVSGALHNLGLFVPGPFLNANESNPKGFYESRWAVRFHQGILREADLHDFDARPHAFALAQSHVTPARRADLVAFLREQGAGHEQVVIKDPRSVWVQRLWGDAATSAGLDIRYLSMLRHPAETVGSRTAYYAAKDADEEQRRRYLIFNIARWLNNSLLNERETRGSRRSFVPYSDLLDDWRTTMGRVRDELGLVYDDDLDPAHAHPLDDFIDPDLRRVRITWDDLQVPDELRTLAQSVWEDLLALREAGGTSPEVSARLDRADDDYQKLFTDSSAIAHDALEEARHRGRRQGAEEARAESKGRQQARRRATAPPAAVPDRLVRDVTSAQLLRTVGGRLRRRVRRG